MRSESWRRLWAPMLLLCSVGLGSAMAQAPSRAHVSEDVWSALKGGPARVVLTLEAPVGRSPAEMQGAAAAAQSAVLQGLRPQGYRVLAQPSHLPLLALEADRDTVDQLIATGGVRAINLDREKSTQDLEAHALTHADEVIAAGFGGQGIRVAVLDSGINGTHVNLQDSLFAEASFLTEGDCPAGSSGPGSAVDQNGHGTHVSGIISGALGTAPDADIIALKVFTTGDTSDTNILNALNAIVANHATWQTRVVNMSLGGGNYPDQASCDADNTAYAAAFAQLNALGIANFVATGNDGSTSAVSSPGCVTGAIGVGSVSDAVFSATFSVCTENGQPDKVTCFSNATATQGAGELVDMLAPGCTITAEWVGSPTAMDTICGTSMATPMAAGIAAALLSRAPDLSPTELEDLLENTADTVVDYRTGVSYPRVNAIQAFNELGVELPTPAGLTAIAVAPDQIDLSWGDVAGEDSYELQRAVGSGSWATIATVAQDATAHADMAPACGLNRYRVRARNSVDDTLSLFSDPAEATARDCPAAPSGLSASVQSASSVLLQWQDNAASETGYRVERSADGGAFVEIASLPADSVSYQDEGFACAGFRYRVRAHSNVLDDYSDYSETVAANPCAPANDLFANATLVVASLLENIGTIRYATVSPDDPAPSCRFSGANPGSNSVWYRFTPSENISVTISTDGSSLIPPPGTDTNFNDTVLAIYTGTPGALTQVACNDDISGSNFLSRITGFTMLAGATYHVYATRWSSVPLSWDANLRVQVTVDLGPPLLSATGATDSVELSWTAVTGADEYRIERKPRFSGSFAQIAAVAAPGLAHTDGSPLACDVYEYRVRAFAAGSPLTPYSDIRTAEPLGCNLAPPHDWLANARLMVPPFNDTTPGVRYAGIEATDPQIQTMGDCTFQFPRSGTNGVWYRYTPEVDGLMTVDSSASTTGTGVLDTVIAIYAGAPGAGAQIACDDESGDGSASRVADLPLQGGLDYFLHLVRWSGTATTSATQAYGLTMAFAPAPSPFDLVTPADGTSTRLPTVPESFAWEAADGAVDYRLTISNAGGDVLVVENILSSSYDLEPAERDLLVEGDYLWQVSAINANGQTIAGNAPFQFTVLPELVPPGGFALDAPGDGAVITLPSVPGFAWTASTGADTYTLVIADGNGDLLTLGGIEGTSYALSAGEQAQLTPGEYSWRVIAVNVDGETVAANAPFAFTIEPDPTPGDFTLAAPADGSGFILPGRPAGFEWTASDRAVSYTLRIEGEGGEVLVVAGIGGTSLALTPEQSELLIAGDYSWQVTAHNAAGEREASNGALGFQVMTEAVFSNDFE